MRHYRDSIIDMTKKKAALSGKGTASAAATVGAVPQPATEALISKVPVVVAGQRRTRLIEHAARLFGVRGFDQTTMRDIASAFGILPGSLYYHFGSKEDLFVAVYTAGVDRFMAAVEAAVLPAITPLDRLEAGCVAHLEELLVEGSLAAAVLADRSATNSVELRAILVKERDRYEKMFRGLTDAVDLPEGVQRRYFHLGLLGALNWTLTWFQPGRDTPGDIARNLLLSFRVK